MTEEFLNTANNFTQNTNEKYTEDTTTFENNRHAIDWEDPKFN